MSFRARGRSARPDVLVVGTGVVGLACATELADRGLDVLLLGRPLPGEASIAAAGLLAPSLESHHGPGSEFGRTARDLYPEWLDLLYENTGIRVALNREGILELGAHSPAARIDGRWLGPETLEAEEPALARGDGAVLHPHDGCVDNVALVQALRAMVVQSPRIRTEPALTRSLEPDRRGGGRGGRAGRGRSGGRGRWRVVDEKGSVHRAGAVILAAGAWTNALAGLPRAIAVEPIRGQMIAFAAAPIRHAVYAPGCYLVPRGPELLAGSTMERTGFDASITDAALEQLAASARAVCPALAAATVARHWAGLRPVTPDMMPIIGRDPESPSLIYATGHSRNGILHARATALAVAAIAEGGPPPFSLAPFAVDRFDPAR